MTYSGLVTWCVDYNQDIYIGKSYTSSTAYTYSYIIANPSLASYIAQPIRLNQVAWIINNIPIGTLAVGPATWTTGTVYTSCTYITASDLQATYWALTQAVGLCDKTLCTDTLSTVNYCNVAYIWNTVQTYVPFGTTYSVPNASPSFTNPIIPLIVIPDGSAQTTQVMVVEAPVVKFGYKCVYPTNSPTIVPTSLPTAGPSSKPTTIPSSIPTAKPSSLQTSTPSSLPSANPTSLPIAIPSLLPTNIPSSLPTDNPSSFI
jgi:hypothetical protein